MILHLGDDVSVHSADIVAIIDLTQSQNPVTGAMLAEIRRQNRILAREPIPPPIRCLKRRRKASSPSFEGRETRRVNGKPRHSAA